MRTLTRAYTDARTPIMTKFMIPIIALVYIVSPLDIIPEILPLFGILDDTMIIPILMWFLIPDPILDDARKYVAMTEKKKSHSRRWILWTCAVFLGIALVYVVWKLVT